jgi:ATP-dependent protease ClpP protease subunit
MTYNLNIDDIIGRWGYSQQYVRNQLAGLKGKPVNVRISSLGGSVADGLDIRQQFIDHGDVTAYLYGCVASSATIVALGAKKIYASKYSMFMVHKVSNHIDALGNYNADQMQALIEQLRENKAENDKYDQVLATLYADRCKKKVEDILDILKAGRWMTAKEALENGFIDEIIEEDDEKFDFSTVTEKLNMLGFPALPLPDDREDSTGLLHNLSAKLDRFISSFKGNVSSPSNSDNNNVITMKKDYLKINAILNLEGLSFDGSGKVAFTEDQVKQINDRMNALEQEVSDKQDLIDKKDEEIQNLQDNAGDDTTHIEGGEGSGKSGESAQEMYNHIKNYL